VKQAFVLLM